MLLKIHLVRRALKLVLASSLLVGCGGGGGGGSGTSASAGGGFTLSTGSIAFSAKQNGQPPPIQSIFVHLTDSASAKVGAGYRTGVTPPTWLSVTAAGSGADYNFSLSVITAVPAASYTTTLTIGTSDANDNILQTKDVQVSYSLKAGLVISTAPATVSAISGASQAMQSVPFTVNDPAGEQWSATSNAAWLVPPASAAAGNFNVAVNTAGLKSGTYQGTVILTSTTDSTDTATFSVTAVISLPTLTVSASTLLLGGASGLDISPQSLSFALTPGESAQSWSVSLSTNGGGAWLQSSVAGGTLLDGGTSITVDADRSQLAVGTYAGQIQLQTTVNGEVIAQTVPVTLNFDRNRLLVNANGAAFSSFPSRKVLTRTLGVLNTWGVASVAWQAHSNQSWLTATASGIAGSPLVLTASATGLAAGQYSAQVTVSSTDSTIANQEVIRVGFTVGNADPQALVDITGVSATNVVTSPVEPWVFVGSPAAASSVRVYDTNSGALLHTYTGPFNNASALAISGDGLTLFVLDTGASTATVYSLDATTGAAQNSYAVPVAPYPSLAYARPDAHAILMSVSNSEVIDLATGTQFPLNMSGPLVSVRADQRRIYMQTTGISPSMASVYEMRYSNLSGVGLLSQLVTSRSNYGDQSANGQDIALSFDGSSLYVANGAPYQFDVLDPVTLLVTRSLPGAAYPGNVETCWNGLVAASSQEEINPAGDSIWVYDSTGAQQALLHSGNDTLTPASLKFSGDGTRLVNASGDNDLIRIQEAPAAP